MAGGLTLRMAGQLQGGAPSLLDSAVDPRIAADAALVQWTRWNEVEVLVIRLKVEVVAILDELLRDLLLGLLRQFRDGKFVLAETTVDGNRSVNKLFIPLLTKIQVNNRQI